MPGSRNIHLREAGDEWVAIEEGTDDVGRGPTAQQALADLEGGDETPETATQPTNPVESVYTGPITISPKVELLFAVAALGVGAIYVLLGNLSGLLVVFIGLALLVRLAWIEYGLFGPKQ